MLFRLQRFLDKSWSSDLPNDSFEDRYDFADGCRCLLCRVPNFHYICVNPGTLSKGVDCRVAEVFGASETHSNPTVQD